MQRYLVQCLIVLPNPPDSVLIHIEKYFIHFYGMVKIDMLLSMKMMKAGGGAKMTHIRSFYKALEMSWFNDLLDPFNHSQRKVLYIVGYIQKWGGSIILYLSKKDLE